MLGDGEVEQELGPVEVHERERIAGLDVVPVSVGNPHAVVVGDPDDLPLIGRLLETHPRFPERTNVQVARVDASGRVTARGLGARGGGDALVGDERGRGRCGDARRGRGRRCVSRRGASGAPRGRPGVVDRAGRARRVGACSCPWQAALVGTAVVLRKGTQES